MAFLILLLKFRCLNKRAHNMGEFLANGQKIPVVTIHYNSLGEELVPRGFETRFEKYNLTVTTRGEIGKVDRQFDVIMFLYL